MRRLLVSLAALAALIPASASAATHRQIADQHAAAHCAQLNCYEWHWVSTKVWPLGGGEQYFYNMHWIGYGFTCHYATDPDVYVSDTLPLTEHNWGGGNASCS